MTAWRDDFMLDPRISSKKSVVVVSAEDTEVGDVVEFAGPALEKLPRRSRRLRDSGTA
jgi:hypothetical protein